MSVESLFEQDKAPLFTGMGVTNLPGGGPRSRCRCPMMGSATSAYCDCRAASHCRHCERSAAIHGSLRHCERSAAIHVPACSTMIGVEKDFRPPLPPNRACGSPAHGSPVSGFLIGIGSLTPGLLSW